MNNGLQKQLTFAYYSDFRNNFCAQFFIYPGIQVITLPIAAFGVM